MGNKYNVKNDKHKWEIADINGNCDANGKAFKDIEE